MTAADPWQPFQQVAQAPWEHVRQWKELNGTLVIGHLLPDVPEEIIHAAGALPVAIEGAGRQVSKASAIIPGYTCSHAMGALEMGLNGELDVLDAMVIPYVCDTTRNLFHIWSHQFPQMKSEFLRVPKRIEHPGTSAYLRSEFTRFMASMEKITGKSVGTEDLSTSINLYNRSRELLRNAYAKHKEMPSLWTGQRLHWLLASAVIAAREEHVRWMEALPWEESASNGSRDMVPVYVRGKVWDPPGIVDLLDQLGLLVVEDEVVTGFRGIAVDASTQEDPVKALASRHLAMVPYTGYHVDPAKAVHRFVERVKASEAAGVIFLNPKFCEPAAFDTPDFQKALEEAEIPSLVLETSSRGVSLGQIRLRLEAFSEMLDDSFD